MSEEINNLACLIHEGMLSLGAEACAIRSDLGVRGYPELRKHRDGHSNSTQWETLITNGIEDLLRSQNGIDVLRDKCYPAEAMSAFDLRFPGARGKRSMFCDLRVIMDAIHIWVETKAVFECVLRNNRDDIFKKHYDGDVHHIDTSLKGALTCVSIEEAWIDSQKMSCGVPKGVTHVGLLLLGFDRVGHELSARNDYQTLVSRLAADGWQACSFDWIDQARIRANRGFCEHLWLWYKKV